MYFSSVNQDGCESEVRGMQASRWQTRSGGYGDREVGR